MTTYNPTDAQGGTCARTSPTRWATALIAGAALALVAAIGLVQPPAGASAFINHTQHFNHDAGEWAGAETEGFDGWCGSMEQVDRRDAGALAPSTGRGYGLATGGSCNDTWTEVFGPDFRSGPFAAGTALSTSFPTSGFVIQSDVYLDPDSAYTANFDYYVAVSDIDIRDAMGLAFSVSYFGVVVSADDGALTVNDTTVATRGWHTFVHRFSDDGDGNLAVEFELAPRNGPALFTQSVEESGALGLPGEPTNSFQTQDIGNGYVWVHLGDGEQLPIDAYQVRAGR